MLDRLVLGERETAEPRAEVFEQSTLSRGLDRLVGIEERREFDERLVQDALDERRHLERLEELLVELVVVRLDRDTLRDEVVREPGKVDGLDPVEHVLDLGLKVGRREVVDDEQDLVRCLLVRRIRVASVLVDANRRKSVTFRLERLLLCGGLERIADHAPDVDTSRGGSAASVLLALEERLTRNVGDVGVELLDVWDREDRVRELRPLAEARLEAREGLNTEAEPVRVGRVAQSIEHVADGDTERDKVDEVVLDQVAKERRRERKFIRRVRVEEPVLIKEAVQEAGKELVVVLVVRLFRLAQSGYDLVDRNLLLVHALVQRVALGLDLGREGGHGHAGL